MAASFSKIIVTIFVSALINCAVSLFFIVEASDGRFDGAHFSLLEGASSFLRELVPVVGHASDVVSQRIGANEAYLLRVIYSAGWLSSVMFAAFVFRRVLRIVTDFRNSSENGELYLKKTGKISITPLTAAYIMAISFFGYSFFEAYWGFPSKDYSDWRFVGSNYLARDFYRIAFSAPMLIWSPALLAVAAIAHRRARISK